MKLAVTLMLVLGSSAVAQAILCPFQGNSKKDCRKLCGKGRKPIFTPANPDAEFAEFDPFAYCNSCECCPQQVTQKHCERSCESLGALNIFKRGKNEDGCKKTCQCYNEKRGTCGEDVSCADGLDCYVGFCHDLKPLGGTCQATLGPKNSDFCEPDLTCVTGPFLGASGTCTDILDAGEQCGNAGALRPEHTVCVEGTECMKAPAEAQPRGLPLLLGQPLTCVKPVDLGEECRTEGPLAEQAWCKGSYVCRQLEADAPSVCVVETTQAQKCKIDPSKVTKSVYCQPGLTCHYGTCQNIVGRGESCNEDLPAETSIKCVKGTRCNGGMCYLEADRGETCQVTVSPEFQVHCKRGLTCASSGFMLGASGVCQKQVKIGKTCQVTVSPEFQVHCQDGLQCVSGGFLGAPGVCRKVAPSGGKCVSQPKYPNNEIYCPRGESCVERVPIAHNGFEGTCAP